MKDPADWILVVLALLVVLGTAGCADLRRMTMTQDELRLYGQWEINPCLDPTVVCIHE